jgi:hypothetical protein
MRLSRSLVLFSFCFALTPVLAACSAESDPASEADATGTLNLALRGASATGTTFDLDARFVVSGPVTLPIDGSGPAVTVPLPVGLYALELQSDWTLFKVVNGTRTAVTAELLSPLTQPFSITNAAVTTVLYRFRAGDDIIVIGNGTLDVRIDVIESGAAETDAALCSNGLDDDRNGLVDCGDPSCAAFCVPSRGLPVDDFEDGDLLSLPSFVPPLPWTPFGDAPESVRLGVVPGAEGTRLALRVQGESSLFAGVVLPQAPVPGAFADLSPFSGIGFHLRADRPGPVRFQLATAAVATVDVGGACTDPARCWDAHGLDVPADPAWRRVEVSWSQLRQAGWGIAAPLDVRTALTLMFVSNAGSTSFEIDQIEYLRR